MEIRDELARNLRLYRQLRDLSQEELAHRAGIDRTYVSSLERCVYGVTIDLLDKLAIALEIEAADLLRKTGPDIAGEAKSKEENDDQG